MSKLIAIMNDIERLEICHKGGQRYTEIQTVLEKHLSEKPAGKIEHLQYPKVGKMEYNYKEKINEIIDRFNSL